MDEKARGHRMRNADDDDTDQGTAPRAKPLNKRIADLAVKHATAAARLGHAAELQRRASASLWEAGTDVEQLDHSALRSYLRELEPFIRDVADAGHDISRAIRDMWRELGDYDGDPS